ncbi:MAG: hypothetical protein E7396_07505 [Ruminococcaceae bacterium]|nr:hypothetical protein [Oscillospiraceae bacterium]
MAKGKSSIAFGVATKVAGVLASKSFDAVTNMVRNFGSGKVCTEDIAALEIEIQNLKIKTEETEKECELLKSEISQKEDTIEKLNYEISLLSKKFTISVVVAVILLIAAIVGFVI